VRVSLHQAELHYANGVVLHTASSGSVPHLHELYLRLDAGDVVGVGEMRANIGYLNRLSPDEVTAEAVAAVAAVDWTSDPVELLGTMERWAASHSAPVRTLIDGALHDLVAKRAGLPLCAWLSGRGIVSADHASNQTLFWSPFDTFLAQAQAYVDRGFRDLKVRVAAGAFSEDLRRIAALRQRFGDGIQIAADANGQWTADDALEHLRALAPHDLAYIEQPIGAGDWDAILALAQASPIPVMLDESVASIGDVERICGLKGRVWAHLKLVKLGGIAATIGAAGRLAQAGVPFMIGQMNEGGAATAAALHVACASQPAFAELYGADGLDDDPAPGIVYADGQVRAGRQPGLGVGFDAAKTQLIREF